MKNSRIISVLWLVLIVMILSIAVSADGYQAADDKIEIIFQQNSAFTDVQKEIIRDYYENAEQSAAGYGLKCILFGHSYVTEYVTTVQHKVSTASPRCLEKVYKTSVCEDCSDTQSTLISQNYIDCCE